MGECELAAGKAVAAVNVTSAGMSRATNDVDSKTYEFRVEQLRGKQDKM